MDKATADNLAIALHQLSEITDKLRNMVTAEASLTTMLDEHRARSSERERAATQTVRTVELPYANYRQITFHVPMSWISCNITAHLRHDMSYSIKATEILLRICLHAHRCQKALYEEAIIEQSGNLAPLLQLQRASKSDLDLPADIRLPRAIDPFSDDEPTTTEEQS